LEERLDKLDAEIEEIKDEIMVLQDRITKCAVVAERRAGAANMRLIDAYRRRHGNV
jgi:hypothetical protein